MRNVISALFIFSFAIGSLAYSVSKYPRPQLGEKQDSAMTPSASTGPRPRNEKEEPYRGPPTGWDEGRVIVETNQSQVSSEHKEEK